MLVLDAAAPLLTAEHLRRSSPSTSAGRDRDDPVVRVGAAAPVRPDRPRRATARSSAIVEERDATAEQRAIRELNSSIYVFESGPLWSALGRLDAHNAQGEHYLTDTIAHIVADGGRAAAWRLPRRAPTLGINTRAELAVAAAVLRDRINEAHMLAGVTIVDPATTWIEPGVELEPDAVDPPVHGPARRTTVGAGAEIGPHAVAVDAAIGEGALWAHSVTFALAPFSRRGRRRGHSWRSRTRASARARRCRTCRTSATPTIGEDTNIAAGNVTANFSHQPGQRKGRTTIGKNVRTGVDNTFIAPVTVGDDAWICRRDGDHGRRPAGFARRLPAEAGDEGRMGLRAWTGRRGDD